MISTPPIVITTTIGIIIIQVILKRKNVHQYDEKQCTTTLCHPPIALPFDDDHNKNNLLALEKYIVA